MIQCARLAFGYAGIYDQDEAERIVEKDITRQRKSENRRHPATLTASGAVNLWKAAKDDCRSVATLTHCAHFKALSREDRANHRDRHHVSAWRSRSHRGKPLVIDGEFQEVGEYDDAAA